MALERLVRIYELPMTEETALMFGTAVELARAALTAVKEDAVS